MDLPSLWYYSAEKQALIFFDPALGGKGTGFSIPEIERTGQWAPKGTLELAIRKVIPPMPGGPPVIQRAASLPPQGFPPNAGRRR